MPLSVKFIYYITYRIANLEKLYDMEIYLQDFAMHDSSRDLLLIDNMRSKGLKGALSQVSSVDLIEIYLINHYSY